MFKNTRDLLKKTVDEVKFLVKLPGRLEPFILIFSIIYQTYMFITDKTLAYVHLALLILVAANYIFRMIVGNVYDSARISFFSLKEERGRNKKLNLTLKTEKRIFNIIKYSIRLFLIVTSVISIARDPSIIKIVATMIIFTELIIEVIVFIIATILDRRVSALQSAFAEDLAAVTQPIRNAGEAVRKTKDAIFEKVGSFFRRNRKTDEPIEADYIECNENSVSDEEETV